MQRMIQEHFSIFRHLNHNLVFSVNRKRCVCATVCQVEGFTSCHTRRGIESGEHVFKGSE